MLFIFEKNKPNILLIDRINITRYRIEDKVFTFLFYKPTNSSLQKIISIDDDLIDYTFFFFFVNLIFFSTLTYI